MENKKVVIVKIIDGTEIVTGFCDRTTDPMATQVAVQPEIQKSAEFTAFTAKEKKIGKCSMDKQNAKIKYQRAQYVLGHGAAKQAEKEVAGQEIEIADKEIVVQDRLMEVLQSDIKPAAIALENKSKILYSEHAVLFEPGKNERIVTAAVLADLEAKFPALDKDKKEVVDIAGNVMMDQRGIVYHEKIDGSWVSAVVQKITDVIPVNAKMEKDLTEIEKTEIMDQLDAARIAELTTAEKQAEYDSVIDGLAGQAAVMRSKLEIQGDSDALADSQAWYTEEVGKLDVKYGLPF